MKLRFEKFSDDQKKMISDDFERMRVMVVKTLGTSVPLSDWFGSANRVRLYNNLKKMQVVITDSTRTATFVNRTGGVLKVEYKSLLRPVLMPRGSRGSPLEEIDPVSKKKSGAVAYAFPVNRMNEVRSATTLDDLDVLDTSSHVGSGMRIYLTSIYFDLDDRHRSATIYHEITHKVLACEDFAYDEADCRNLAGTPDKAIRNADSYAMFLLHC